MPSRSAIALLPADELKALTSQVNDDSLPDKAVLPAAKRMLAIVQVNVGVDSEYRTERISLDMLEEAHEALITRMHNDEISNIAEALWTHVNTGHAKPSMRLQ